MIGVSELHTNSCPLYYPDKFGWEVLCDFGGFTNVGLQFYEWLFYVTNVQYKYHLEDKGLIERVVQTSNILWDWWVRREAYLRLRGISILTWSALHQDILDTFPPPKETILTPPVLEDKKQDSLLESLNTKDEVLENIHIMDNVLAEKLDLDTKNKEEQIPQHNYFIVFTNKTYDDPFLVKGWCNQRMRSWIYGRPQHLKISSHHWLHIF